MLSGGKNPFRYQNDSEKLDKFRVKYYEDRLIALLYQLLFMQKIKTGSEIGKVCFRKHWLVYVSVLLHENSKYYRSQVLLTVALCSKYDGQPVIIWELLNEGLATQIGVSTFATF